MGDKLWMRGAVHDLTKGDRNPAFQRVTISGVDFLPADVVLPGGPINMCDDPELIEDLSSVYPKAKAEFGRAYFNLLRDGDAPAHEQHEPIETRQLKRSNYRTNLKQTRHEMDADYFEESPRYGMNRAQRRAKKGER